MSVNTHTIDGSTAADWSAALIGTDFIEYRRGRDTCLVNVAFEPQLQARAIYASEAESPWFPHLAEHLRCLLPGLPGRFVLV